MRFLQEKDKEEGVEESTLVDPLVQAVGPRWQSMKTRMAWAGDLED